MAEYFIDLKALKPKPPLAGATGLRASFGPHLRRVGSTGLHGATYAGYTGMPSSGPTGAVSKRAEEVAEATEDQYGLLFKHTISREGAQEILGLGEDLDKILAEDMPRVVKSSLSKAVHRLVGVTEPCLTEDHEIACCFKNLFLLHSMHDARGGGNDLAVVIIGRLYGELASLRQNSGAWVRLLHSLIQEPWPFMHYSAFSDLCSNASMGSSWESLLSRLAAELDSCRSNKFGRSAPTGLDAKDIPLYLYARGVGSTCSKMVRGLAEEKAAATSEFPPQHSIIGMLLRMAALSANRSPTRPNDKTLVRWSDVLEYQEKAVATVKANNDFLGYRCRSLIYRANEVEKAWFIMAGHKPRMSGEISAAIAYEAEARSKAEAEEASRKVAEAALMDAAEEKKKTSILSGPPRKALRDLCAGRPANILASVAKIPHDHIIGAFMRRSPEFFKYVMDNQERKAAGVKALLKYPSLFPALLVAEPDPERYAVSEEAFKGLQAAYRARNSTLRMVEEADAEVRSAAEALAPYRTELPVQTGITVYGVQYQSGIESDPLGVWVLAGCPGVGSFDTGVRYGILGCASSRSEDLLLFLAVLKTLSNRGLIKHGGVASIQFDSSCIGPYNWENLLKALGAVSDRIGNSRNGISIESDRYSGLSYSELATMSDKQHGKLRGGSGINPLLHFHHKVVELRRSPLAFWCASTLTPLLALFGEVVRTGGACVDPRPTVFRSVSLERLGLPRNVVQDLMEEEQC